MFSGGIKRDQWYEVGETIKFATLQKINKGLHLIGSI